MSVTTSDNPITTTIRHDVLRDYDIHLTGHNETAAPNSDNRPPPASNPPDWPSEEHRGLPPYRPINTELDMSQRPWAGSPAGQVFVFAMLNGVWLNANVAWIWRNTGGRINDRIFRYKVGGEF